MQNKTIYNCWPTATQLLLIKAGALPSEQAISYWKEWRSLVDVQQLDSVSNRLLTLVYYNLKNSGLTSTEFQVCKSTYRHTWVDNQILFHEFFKVMKLFNDADIQAITLKGAAQCMGYYHDIGARVMGDIDILLPYNQAVSAVKLLLAEGWKFKDIQPEQFNERFLFFRHAVGMFKSNHVHIDIHWHLSTDTCNTGIEAKLFDATWGATFEGHTVRLLAPSDQLFHTLIHGLKFSPEPLIRWVPDALSIILTKSALDWDRLLELAKQARLSYPIFIGLQYLDTNFALPIPVQIMQQLEKIATNAEEIKSFHAVNLKSSATPLQTLWLLHARVTGFKPLSYRLCTFPIFLKRFWGLDTLWKLPLYAMSKYGAYLGRRFKKSPSRDTIQA